MLGLHGVGYRYAGYATEVLHDLELTLGDGEIAGVVGANESGKSTLCLVASGLAPIGTSGPVSHFFRNAYQGRSQMSGATPMTRKNSFHP